MVPSKSGVVVSIVELLVGVVTLVVGGVLVVEVTVVGGNVSGTLVTSGVEDSLDGSVVDGDSGVAVVVLAVVSGSGSVVVDDGVVDSSAGVVL